MLYRLGGSFSVFDKNTESVLEDGAPLAELITVLADSRYCFLKVLSRVTAIVSRSDVQKPTVQDTMAMKRAIRAGVPFAQKA